jgi:hypothetical protein
MVASDHHDPPGDDVEKKKKFSKSSACEARRETVPEASALDG